MKRTQFRITETQYRELRRVATRRNSSVSELVREAVSQWLCRQETAAKPDSQSEAPAFHFGAIRVSPESLREEAYEDSELL